MRIKIAHMSEVNRDRFSMAEPLFYDKENRICQNTSALKNLDIDPRNKD